MVANCLALAVMIHTFHSKSGFKARFDWWKRCQTPWL